MERGAFCSVVPRLHFFLVTSWSDAEIMKHNRGKYLEERAYSGASADVLTLPGHGFTKGANVKIH